MAFDRRLCADVLEAFADSLLRHLRWRAKRAWGLASVDEASVGAITFIWRCDSSLRLNPHFHTLAPDGAWVSDGQGELQFHALPEPSPEELALGRGDGRYGRILSNLARKQVLVLDDWGLAPFTDMQRRDLLEILEERQIHKSLVIASQVPVDKWHDAIGDPTLADAILDRIVHYAHEVKLKGESMRKPEQGGFTLPDDTKPNGDT